MRARNSRHADTSNLVYWASAQSGQWSDAQNWSTGKAPETADTAVISARRPAGKYDVAITHPASAGILRINAPSASVDDESTLKIGSVLELDAGTFYLDLGGNLTGGRIVVGAGAKFAPIGGTLSHIKFEGTMSGNGNLTIGAGVSFSAARGNGPAMIDSIGGTIAVVGTSRLNNVDISLPGTLISRASSTETGLLVLGGNVTVTQAPNSFFEREYPTSILAGTNAAVINNGTINAEVTDGLLVMDANLLNNGHINVGHGDTIDLIGTVTGQRAARLINSMDNNGGQIAIGGTVAGGILNATVSGYGGTFSGVRVQGTLSLDSPSFDVGYLYGLTVTGATSFAGSGGAGPATIDLSNGTTLTFDGSNAINDSVINMDGSSLITADAGSSATTLTLGRHSVVNIGLNESVLGPASDTTADQIINDGIINVTGPTGSTLVLDVSHFTSNGQINLASGDSIILQGSSTSNFGTISGDAATALINDVHNTGGSFGIDAVIVGGTLSGAFAEQSSYGTLAQLAFEGSIVIGGGGQIGVEAGMTFSGAQGVGRAAVSVGEGSELYGVGAATIDNAAINLGSASYGNEAGLGQRDLISGNTATPGILTLGSATTVTQTNTYAFIYAGGQAGDGLINEGTIDATYAGGTLSVATASSFTNDGTFTIGAETAAFSVVGTFTNNAALTFGSGSSITFTSSTLTNAAAGSLALAASAGATTSLSGDKYSMITNDGTLAASGSGTVAVSAATVNAGMITAGNGTLQFLADLTNDGTITATGGIVQVGTLLAGNGTVDIGAGASASLLAGAASTQTVDFTSSTGELVIKAPLAFLAGIAGFGSNDVIQLTKTAETGYSFGNGALTITDGTSIVASLTFAGSYTQQDFSVTENAHGNTIITHT